MNFLICPMYDDHQYLSSSSIFLKTQTLVCSRVFSEYFTVWGPCTLNFSLFFVFYTIFGVHWSVVFYTIFALECCVHDFKHTAGKRDVLCILQGVTHTSLTCLRCWNKSVVLPAWFCLCLKSIVGERCYSSMKSHGSASSAIP